MIWRGRGDRSSERSPLPLPRLSHGGSKPAPDERGTGRPKPSRWMGDEALQTAQAEKVGIPGIEKRTGDEKERSTLLRRLVITRHLTNKTSFSFPLKTAVPCSQRNQQLGAK